MKRSVFKHDEPIRPNRRRWLWFVIFVVVLLAVSASFWWYRGSLRAVDPDSTETQTVVVEQGTNEELVSVELQEKGLIRSAAAFNLYIRLHRVKGQMQVGEYEFSAAMPVSEIVDRFVKGRVAVKLLTILPSQRIDQIETAFLKAGYSQDEVVAALNPASYSGHAALAEKPPAASLEGYLYPESFQVTSTTPLEAVVSQSLDQLAAVLTPDLLNALSAQGFSIHDAIIMASIVEREVSNTDDRKKVAQVLLRRLNEGIRLQSDPTAHYGALMVGLEPSVRVDTLYNTYLYEGLPPGPISNVTADSLWAVAEPAATNYLYFVAGDDGQTYFSNTLAEHEALTAAHCIELCQAN